MIVWDLAGVVATFVPERRVDAVSRCSGLAPGEIDDSIWSLGDDGHLGEDELWTQTLAALDGRLSRAELRACWAAAFVPDEEMLTLVDDLDEMHPLLTTNGPILEAALQRELSDVARHFHPLLFTWRLGATKHSVDAFVRAAEMLGYSGEELTLVDDTLANVEAARRAGWNAIHFTGIEPLLADLALDP
jgi:HAD superfamily hydrolase (TIGR01509 family)